MLKIIKDLSCLIKTLTKYISLFDALSFALCIMTCDWCCLRSHSSACSGLDERGAGLRPGDVASRGDALRVCRPAGLSPLPRFPAEQHRAPGGARREAPRGRLRPVTLLPARAQQSTATNVGMFAVYLRLMDFGYDVVFRDVMH